MIDRRSVLAGAACCALAGCGSRFKSYDGPEVTRILVQKDGRRMHLLHHDQVLKTYRIALGYAPLGDKRHEGDGRTPEGRYYIDRRNPNSEFHLSLGISYPNRADIAEAAALGKPAGGDIFIHGRAGRHRGKGRDWTAGCIAVKDREIEDIYAMVREGTVIDILP
ncbi:L,D-transpeptidase-like protein [Rhodovulum bhavnagarense]|uniref:L,D-transpeptidase-like protein n=1 Tax=Rhodovulum bhavnagarense TaxID=992286 RepID=A0A4V2SWA5_9RHOB|nr:L,D-transpeptidase family protein [Rhodovulum bhavnagarense]TCP61106.1 L,D-transpeptidase-like protein [Rhodovulum bhavnagarense]